ncbi:hypothetical protein ES288_A08G190400v1 [Gossypium darwinii]|uniref:Uncharacterized protein n=1 Tax=Gossypium darwinii TaxID=34276 RepID=A0A5D2FNQ3_GOSDA|nr:hypothetical protein ES288_A08G190400v1 [Gossypium darwinii]
MDQIKIFYGHTEQKSLVVTWRRLECCGTSFVRGCRALELGGLGFPETSPVRAIWARQ